jgi:hypothetical protein
MIQLVYHRLIRAGYAQKEQGSPQNAKRPNTRFGRMTGLNLQGWLSTGGRDWANQTTPFWCKANSEIVKISMKASGQNTPINT